MTAVMHARFVALTTVTKLCTRRGQDLCLKFNVRYAKSIWAKLLVAKVVSCLSCIDIDTAYA